MTCVKYFITVFFVFFSLVCCFGQNVSLYTQVDVDNFDPTATVINGYLYINGNNSVDPITNLNNLSNLTSISERNLIS